MRILYAIQGTGNGHISRARDIVPLLMKKGTLDVLISGTEADVDLPFFVKYRLNGLCFVFGKNGGIDLLKTYKKGNLKKLYAEIKNLPVEDYDLVINDFEPVSAWACKLKNVNCISLSHQSAVINKRSPKPKQQDIVGKIILENYAPVSDHYGFHFEAYDKNIFTPVIRNEIRRSIPAEKDHYTVYLPAYSDKRIINMLSQLPDVRWHVFSKHSDHAYEDGNIIIQPVDNDDFVKSLISCKGILCGAGFETPAEALYLKKKLIVIPMKGQYEQHCNAAALKKLGVGVIKSLKQKHFKKIKEWVQFEGSVSIEFPDNTEEIIDGILLKHNSEQTRIKENILGELPYSNKKFRKLSLGKIMKQISG